MRQLLATSRALSTALWIRQRCNVGYQSLDYRLYRTRWDMFVGKLRVTGANNGLGDMKRSWWYSIL